MCEMTFEAYLRQQAERGQFGVAMIESKIALGIADWIELQRDAVPVVRCKDCKYGYQFYDVQKGITDIWVECRNPNGLNRDVPEDGYCFCGERRSDVD